MYSSPTPSPLNRIQISCLMCCSVYIRTEAYCSPNAWQLLWVVQWISCTTPLTNRSVHSLRPVVSIVLLINALLHYCTLIYLKRDYYYVFTIKDGYTTDDIILLWKEGDPVQVINKYIYIYKWFVSYISK